MSHHHDDGIVLALFGLGLGPYLFYKGFCQLRLKKLIEAIATSKVRSLAMGTVELVGKACAAAPLLDPIYQKPCALFQVKVEERRGSGKNSRWVSIYSQDSFSQPLFLEDDTGRILVFPSGADAHLKTDVKAQTGLLFGKGDEAALQFMKSIVGSSRERRLKAQIVRDGDPFYVLGCAAAPDGPQGFIPQAVQDIRCSLGGLAQKLKADPQRMKALDLNNDGMIDPQEWDEGLRRFGEEVAAADDSASAQPQAEVLSACVRQGPDGLLVIADESERELIGELIGSAALYIIGGPLITIASAAYLAEKFGLLSAFF